MPHRIDIQYQQQTKNVREQMIDKVLDVTARPDQYKMYPGSKKITLPEPNMNEAVTLDEVLHDRRSIRSYTDQPINLDQLSYLLWASSGISGQKDGKERRTAPSSGALYPIETYLVVNNVIDLGSGVYHYNVRSHALEVLRPGQYGKEMEEAAMGQDMCRNCSVIFIWTAIFERSAWKYEERSIRYIYMDTGHIAQNLALAGTALNLGACPMSSFFDDEVNEIIGVDGNEESVVYSYAVGNIIK